MKALHKIALSKYSNAALNNTISCKPWIQVKDGWVNVTDAYVLARYPVEEIFGQGIIENSEEFYISALQWKSAKMDKAVSINRNGLTFEAVDRKGNIIGTVITKNEAEFKEINAGKQYPDIVPAIPVDQTILTTAFNPQVLNIAAEVLGATEIHINRTSVKNHLNLITDPRNTTSKGIVGVMPCSGFWVSQDLKTSHPFADSKEIESNALATKEEWEILNTDLDKAKEEIEDLERRIDDLTKDNSNLKNSLSEFDDFIDPMELTECQTATGHTFRYSTENPIDEQLLSLFTECLKDISPADMYENLKLIKQYKTVI